jgi:DNA-binding transcriptional regulator LsrR (DeoR family)
VTRRTEASPKPGRAEGAGAREGGRRPNPGRAEGAGASRGDFLVEVARLYYEKDLSQQEIAHTFGISRSSVSNLLKLCREQGIVEIRINDASSLTVRQGRELCERFGLGNAIVVASNPDPEQAKVHVGRAAAALAQSLLADGMRIGISWGTTLYQLVRHINPAALPGIQVIQLHGGLGAGNPDIDGFGLAQKLAEKLEARYRIIQAPMVVQSPSLKEMLLREPGIAETLREGASVDIALFGIGSNVPALSSLVRAGYLSESESLELLSRGAVATVCGLHIDREGRVAASPLNERIIGIDASTVLSIPVRLGAAAGAGKAEAVRAAIQGKFINTLVVDEEIAVRVLAAGP